jgi:predicted nucleic acid-binding protein
VPGPDIAAFELALAAEEAVLPPAVIAEAMSAPEADAGVAALLAGLRMLPIMDEYWERVGQLRRLLRARGRRARLGDALISQSCLDHDVPLLTRDRDFRAYAEFCGLKLA